MKPETFVLVHGAWHGGWCWAQVAARIEASGHRVCNPTLAGLSERSDELTTDTGLRDHVDEVEALIKDEGLRDVVLILHSYAGMIGRALESRCPERIAAVVYVEAVVPETGEALLDIIPPVAREKFLGSAMEDGEGWRIPPPDPAQFFIEDPAVVALLSRRLTDQPLKAFTEKSEAVGSGFISKRLYLFASDRAPQPYQNFIERFSRDDRWQVKSLTGGHEMMLTNPEGLVGELLEFVSRSDPDDVESHAAITRDPVNLI